MSTYFGKYRGKVEANADPKRLGRLQVSVPAVYGSERTNWARPCVPYAGRDVGWFVMPPRGASVWVEFEGGDLNYPIWTGCFWGDQETLPLSPVVPEIKVLKTGKAMITIDEREDTEGVTIQTKRGMKIAVTKDGIELDNGQGAKITLSGSQVKVNDGALEVT